MEIVEVGRRDVPFGMLLPAGNQHGNAPLTASGNLFLKAAVESSVFISFQNAWPWSFPSHSNKAQRF